MALPSLYEISATYRQDLEKLGDLDLDDQTITDTLAGLTATCKSKARTSPPSACTWKT